MGFLSLYSGTVRLDVTDPSDPNGHWWVDVKKTLSGAELDIAEGKKLQMTAVANDDTKAAKMARERARLEMMGVEVQEESEPGTKTNVRIDTAAYRLELLTLAITNWNLTDEHDRLLPLAPLDAKRRSIKLLPPGVYDMIVARVEDNAEASKASASKDEREAFRESGV
jgi:hypothetical protein